MELISGLSELNKAHKGCVASIGNYDGVHLGHQHVIKTLLEKSSEFGLPSTVITFEPLAKEFFRPNSVARITTNENRAELLGNLGIDRVLAIEFNSQFSAYSPKGFVQDVLIEALGLKYLCVGDDFRFGKDRAGDFELLQQMGKQYGFSVAAHDTYELDGARVSSGRVRDSLTNSNFELAKKLLGRPFTIDGSVSKGQQLGRTLNFPTANIVLPNHLMPVNGVFAVKVSIADKGELSGVANIGRRPTVDGTENRLEVHLFDFDQDIYGQRLSVELIAKIRDEVKFDGVESLKLQIAKDASQARDLLG